MNDLLYLIVYLLVGALLLYVINIVIGMLELPAQVKTIALIIVGIVFLVWILRTLGIFV